MQRRPSQRHPLLRASPSRQSGGVVAEVQAAGLSPAGRTQVSPAAQQRSTQASPGHAQPLRRGSPEVQGREGRGVGAGAVAGAGLGAAEGSGRGGGLAGLAAAGVGAV